MKTTQKKRMDDCKLKGAILRAVYNSHGCATSRQIYEMINTINYHNYNAFRVSLNQYVRRGYLKREGDKKPYHYYLTAKGSRHAIDPFVLKRERRVRYQKHIIRILGTKQGFKQGVKMFIRQNPYQALQEIYKSPYFKDNSIFHRYYKEKINDLNAIIDALVIHVLNKEDIIRKQQDVIGTQQLQLKEQSTLLGKY